MSFISYAQNYEDVMLWRALKHVENGFYIDVGAAWPDEHSVTKAFYERGWRGINVEPNPVHHASLIKQRPRDINLQLAVGESPGTLTMNLVGETGLSTLDTSIANQHQNGGWNITQQTVGIDTLASICSQHVPPGQEVHFLKIDIEGFEEQALKSNNWTSFRPWIVLVEATLPLTQQESYDNWEPILLDADYLFSYADGLNRFYIAKEHSDLMGAFKYPPNVFDGFVLTEKVQAEAKAQQAHEQAMQAEVRAQHAEAEKTALINSISWKITYPLRKLNPTRLAKVFLIRTGKFVISRPRLLYMIKPAAKMQPWFWERLKRVAFFDSTAISEDLFEEIQFDNKILHFSRGPLTDHRGIGRVARELLHELQKTQTVTNLEQDCPASINIFFYASIHWCPKTLPHPCVVMVHDVTPLVLHELFPKAIVGQWLNRYKLIAQQADHIVTISQTSAIDISNHLGVPKDRISVIYNGVTKLPINTQSAIALPTAPFIVYTGSYDHHKNVDVVLRALSHDSLKNVHLVMIGDNKGCLSVVRELEITDRVHFLGHVEDAEMGRAISTARALVFPSLYEGFGLPPMEAALLGTPSICSWRPAMTELLDGAVLFADPHNEEDWVSRIYSIINDSILRDELASKAQQIAQSMSWEKAALNIRELVTKNDYDHHNKKCKP